MNVVIIGSGYVGLVSGACFAEFGANVRCVDNDSEKIKNLKNGIIPIYEPGLQELVNRNLQNDCLSFHENLKDVISDADLVFIAVGTPTRRGDGHADLKYVYEVAEEIAKLIQSHIVVVNKSTVPISRIYILTGSVVLPVSFSTAARASAACSNAISSEFSDSASINVSASGAVSWT